MTTSRMYRLLSYLVLCSLPLVTGCGSQLSMPPVDPQAATEAAFKLYDADGDGLLDAEEMLGSPALAAELGEYDTDGDKKISKKEMLDRIIQMYERNIAYTKADCIVTLDGKQLSGATVRYIPESYLGEGTTHPAEGTTDTSGFANLSMAAELLPEDAGGRALMQVGLYRVEITHPTKSIPAKYNTETTLGFELHPARHYGPHGKFDLVSK